MTRSLLNIPSLQSFEEAASFNLSALRIRPAWLNTLSTEAEAAGTERANINVILISIMCLSER